MVTAVDTGYHSLMSYKIVGRICAGIVASSAIATDGAHMLVDMYSAHIGWPQGLATESMYFTDLTIMLVSFVFTAIALNVPLRRRSWLLGATVLCMFLSAVGTQGWRLFANCLSVDALAHAWIPLATALWWFAFAKKGELTISDPFTWSVAPVAYLAYALIRGELTGGYPYERLNPEHRGWRSVLIIAFLQLVVFELGALILFICDYFLHWLQIVWRTRQKSPL